MAILFAALLALTSSPVSTVSVVSSVAGRCAYQTGDVLLTADQFRGQLIGLSKWRDGLVIYHAPHVPQRCVERARRIARDAGFMRIRIETAPADLDMGPPR